MYNTIPNTHLLPIIEAYASSTIPALIVLLEASPIDGDCAIEWSLPSPEGFEYSVLYNGAHTLVVYDTATSTEYRTDFSDPEKD